jgi:undecaprenyl-diphosphatase
MSLIWRQQLTAQAAEKAARAGYMTNRSGSATRLAIAAGGIVLTTASVRHDHVAAAEEKVFRLVNDLPERIYRPVWLIMQLGTIGAAPAAAAVALMAGERRLASRLVVAGTATWALSKVFKRWIGRPRPASLLDGTHLRGSEATGLGYLSGHAGVAVALGVAALPSVGRPGRLFIGGLVPAVGLARMYIGAHLPLDIVGGAALGLAVEAATDIYQALRNSADRA